MEGLGIAANVIAVVDLTAKTCTVCYHYAKSAKECPKTVALLQQELTAVKSSLDGLQDISHRLDEACKAAREPPPLISQLSTTLNECSETLSKLTQELEGSRRNKLREKLRWQLKWPIKESEINDFIARLGRYQQTFQQALSADILSVTLDIRAEVGEVITGIGEAATEIQKARSEQSKDILDRAVQIRRAKLDKLVKWLAPLHYNVKHEQSVETHHEDTGTWLFDNDLYRDWESVVPSRLWIHGIPGSDSDKTIENADQIIQELYSGFSKGKGPPADIKSLANLFTRVATLYPRFIIVIDGLDECPMEQRGELLEFVVLLASGNLKNASILIISRLEVDIQDKLKGFPTISLENEQVNLKDDMRKVINKEFEDMEKWGRFQTLKDEIAECLILGSGKNMFRWLQCQLDLLSRLRTPNAIREALQKLPRTLFEMYDRMLECIEKEESSIVLACKAFQWMVQSRRALELGELIEAIALNEGDRRLDLNRTFADPRDLLRICSSLVYVENWGTNRAGSLEGSEHEELLGDGILRKEVQICHNTVKEYLVSDYLRAHSTLSHYAVAKKESQGLLARLTLTYLLLDDFSEPAWTSELQLDALEQNYRLYNHCLREWFRYCADVEHEDDNLLELVDMFIFDSPATFLTFSHMVRRLCCRSNPRHTQLWCPFCDDRGLDLRNLLFTDLITHNRSWYIRRILKKRPELLNSNIGRAGPAIRTAALAGRGNLLRDLIEMGADIHRTCPSHDLPHLLLLFRGVTLQWTGSIGGAYNHAQYISREYTSDGQPNEDTLFEYPIHAISQFTPKVLPFVLERGIHDVNVRSGSGSVPLHHAVLGNSLEAVQLLVAAGGNINAETHVGRTPVHIAVSLHAGTILEYLLDVNVTIPIDLTLKQLEWINDEPYHGIYLSVDEWRSEKNARGRLLQTIQSRVLQKSAQALPSVPDNWVRTSVFREETVTTCRLVRSAEPYISITIEGQSLKRIVFRMLSNDTVLTQKYYRRLYIRKLSKYVPYTEFLVRGSGFHVISNA
ncbi:hypothetical protein K440DRAFT_642057 [Wilcoxina mikolae CBS 423.85]|nr:hypothetical protein K440DRAFT_642057 [Wilcoxina mikolae CBS 423.85]